MQLMPGARRERSLGKRGATAPMARCAPFSKGDRKKAERRPPARPSFGRSPNTCERNNSGVVS